VGLLGLFLFGMVWLFPCILHVYLMASLRFFNKILLLIKKTKKVTRPFGVGVHKYIRRGGKLFQHLLDMRWVIGQRSVFGMMLGVRNNH
jgi:hypothetical protein